jgi:MFS family permease
MPGPPKPHRSYYRWVIVGTGTLSIFACLGFGRFALGMLLPSMASGLGLSYAQLGTIGTANFIGYLAAVLAAGPIAARIGSRLLVFLALLVVGASMFLMSRAGGYATLLALYTVTGFGSGAANVPTMALIARWFERELRGRAAGFVAIGSGFAIIVAGKLIPYVNHVQGPEGWRTNWLILAAAVTAIAFVSLLLLRNAPAGAGAGSVAEPAPQRAAPVAAGPADRVRAPAVYLLGFLYAIFGFTYAIYVTFIVTTLVHERGFSEAVAGNFWSWVGFLSLLSGPVFGSLSDRIGRRGGLVVVFLMQMLAYLLAAADLPILSLYLSIGLFGLAAWSIPTIMIATVGDHVGPERALSVFGFITFFFGIGQVAGPAIAGILAESTGSFASSFFMAAAFAAVAVLVCVVFLRNPGHAAVPSRDTKLAGSA